LLVYTRQVDCNQIVTIETKNGQTEPNETKNRDLFINQFNWLKLQHKADFA
jgi:hypothetical protein